MGKRFRTPVARLVNCADTGGFLKSPCDGLRSTVTDRRGAAAIEFALSLPVMMLMVVGAFDYGNVAYTAMEVDQAAHAGAFYAYNAAVTGGSCSTSGITSAETSATSLGSSITTSTTATGASALAKAAPSCTYSGCYSSSGVTAPSGSTCSGGDAPGTYAVAYAQLSFTPLLPWTALVFPSTLSATAVIRYK